MVKNKISVNTASNKAAVFIVSMKLDYHIRKKIVYGEQSRQNMCNLRFLN